MRLDVLKKAYIDKSMIGFRTNKLDWDELIIGYITELNDISFFVNELDENGFFIGITEILIKDIINIDINDRYQKRLSVIKDNNSKFDSNKRVTIWKEKDYIIPYLKRLLFEKEIVTLYISEAEYTGLIIKYNKTHIAIKLIGDDGEFKGISFQPINGIIGVRYNSLKEQRIKLLYENWEK